MIDLLRVFLHRSIELGADFIAFTLRGKISHWQIESWLKFYAMLKQTHVQIVPSYIKWIGSNLHFKNKSYSIIDSILGL